MYILKNGRNYIPLIAIMLSYFYYFLGGALDNGMWSERVLVILLFVVVPISNIVTVVLNCKKYSKKKKVYRSSLFALGIQAVPALLAILFADRAMRTTMLSYGINLLMIDAALILYLIMGYQKK